MRKRTGSSNSSTTTTTSGEGFWAKFREKSQLQFVIGSSLTSVISSLDAKCLLSNFRRVPIDVIQNSDAGLKWLQGKSVKQIQNCLKSCSIEHADLMGIISCLTHGDGERSSSILAITRPRDDSTSSVGSNNGGIRISDIFPSQKLQRSRTYSHSRRYSEDKAYMIEKPISDVVGRSSSLSTAPLDGAGMITAISPTVALTSPAMPPLTTVQQSSQIQRYPCSLVIDEDEDGLIFPVPTTVLHQLSSADTDATTSPVTAFMHSPTPDFFLDKCHIPMDHRSSDVDERISVTETLSGFGVFMKRRTTTLRTVDSDGAIGAIGTGGGRDSHVSQQSITPFEDRDHDDIIHF